MRNLTLIHSFCAAAPVAFSQQKTNVLLIVADGLGFQLPCNGDRHIQAPHMEADPSQSQKLAAAPSHTATLECMKALSLEWRMETEEPETEDPYLDPATLAAKHDQVNSHPSPLEKMKKPIDAFPSRFPISSVL
ncbi:MAG: hypothetical protein MUF86_17600 [Akkermansiaceae bacterium]|jgi:hypothetical protein|nr:hypothetical protein [Akkermansiaceae bacterium]